ncbi:hypothetical protein LX15_000407 [Streptoalloteichus tenebrarius]|uniref:Uncharacterized protein n=1 Tax=Streptoalloteichus tenebrarius (strain ATCC 17920 / DSM 40477 / JCM 4838 / CBS 697.72 / NBRC 16177 / NCIMB 11028 / NRRL B-12390 / A12253. 1 / ISP 5477) TaxID=1933 RepID=A0ABT1HMI4_STRSD|nr:hypothetical protein [Streptoalloteichus tenebrarius]MCP2256724.1 hypothetical protein [Streptoalloteichus tenebrarius]BFF00374.1 hypothetical protein GCM10020241_20490 [Streptoalloteichus tenebrarius]
MMMENFAPEAPHLSIAVYPSSEEDQALRGVYEVLHKANRMTDTCLVLAPEGARFEAISDLADSIRVVDLDEDPAASGIFELDGPRVVRVRLLDEEHGVVVLGYERAGRDESHPVSLVLSADALGVPSYLWTDEEGRRARSLGRWARRTLRLVCDSLDPLYGHLAVEETLPPPSEFRKGVEHVRGEFYVSQRLVGGRSEFVDSLVKDYGASLVSTWGRGYFICGWPPFGGPGLTDDETRMLELRMTEFLAERTGS